MGNVMINKYTLKLALKDNKQTKKRFVKSIVNTLLSDWTPWLPPAIYNI